MKHEFKLLNSNCAACELWLKTDLLAIDGVESVEITNSNIFYVVINPSSSEEDVLKKVDEVLATHAIKNESTLSKPDLILNHFLSFLIALIISLVFVNTLGLQSLSSNGNITFYTAFVAGIFSSLTTCGASIGGLLASWNASLDKKQSVTSKGIVILNSIFHVTRIISFAILGLILGSIGEFVLISGLASLFNVIILLVMLILAFNLLEISLPTKYLPKLTNLGIFTNIFDNVYKYKTLGAIILGVSTIFIQCGFMATIELAAAATKSPLSGGILMVGFVLGTLPTLIILSIFTRYLSEFKYKNYFFKILAYIILFFVVYQLYNFNF